MMNNALGCPFEIGQIVQVRGQQRWVVIVEMRLRTDGWFFIGGESPAEKGERPPDARLVWGPADLLIGGTVDEQMREAAEREMRDVTARWREDAP